MSEFYIGQVLDSTNLAQDAATVVTYIEQDPLTIENDTWVTHNNYDDASALFGDLDAPDAALDGEQTFRCRVRSSDNELGDPADFTWSLTENGNEIQTFANGVEVTQDQDGEVVTGTVDATEIGNAADLEMEFDLPSTGGMPGTRDIVELNAVEWEASLNVFVDVTTDEATDIGVESATVNGTVDWEGDNVDVWFEWRQTGETTWNQTAPQTFTTSGERSFDETITALSDDTEYEFRARADRDNGDEMDTGATLTFWTTPSDPAPPSNLSGSFGEDYTMSSEGEYTGHTDNVNDVWVGDSYLYSAADSTQVHKIDPTDMTQVDTYTGHGDDVTGIWGDGSYLYSVSRDSEVHKIDPTDMTQVDTYTGHDTTARDVWGDGTNLYSVAGEEVHQLDPTDMTQVNTYTGHGGTVLAIWGDGTHIYTGANDDSVHKLDPTDMTQVDTYTHGNTVRAVWGDETYVYSGGSDTDIHQLDPSDMTEVDRYTGFDLAVRAIWVGEDYIYVGGSNEIVRKLDPTDMSLESEYLGHRFEGIVEFISGDGTYFYSGGGDGEIHKVLPEGLEVDLDWDLSDDDNVIDTYNIYREIDPSTETDPTFPDDYEFVDSVDSGVSTYQDLYSSIDIETIWYAVTAVDTGSNNEYEVYSSPDETEVGAGATIIGTVWDSDSNPVANALVRVVDTSDIEAIEAVDSAETDADGEYVIDIPEEHEDSEFHVAVEYENGDTLNARSAPFVAAGDTVDFTLNASYTPPDSGSVNFDITDE